ncbi:MAG: hypothetical protein AB7D43_01725 [Sulfurimonadaceae bacterium]
MHFEKEINAFSEKFGLTINPQFLEQPSVASYMLEHVCTLLESIPQEGLKLTAKGNLPSKVVEILAHMPSTFSDMKCIEYSKRYIEDEQIIPQRAHVLCHVAKLVKIEKNKLLLTKKGQTFLRHSRAEQFVTLFISFFQLNLGYFDRREKAPIIQAVTPIFIQTVRDKEQLPRTTEVFGSILLDSYPQLYDTIEKEIQTREWSDKDAVDHFFTLLDHRVITNFLAPMGLVEVAQKEETLEAYSYEKTPLLDQLLAPKEAIDATKVFDRRTLNDMLKHCASEKLEINLFREVISSFTAFATREALDKNGFIQERIEAKKVIGTQREKYVLFYTQLFENSQMTLRQFTQLDTKGGREDLIPKYHGFMRGLYDILEKKTPHVLLEEMHFLTFSLFFMLEKALEIDMSDQHKALQALGEKTNEEFMETLNAYMYSFMQLQKLCKKQTKIKPQITQMTEQALQTFMITVFEIYTGEL